MDEQNRRPPQVTFAAWTVIIGSCLVLVSVFEQFAELRSLDTRTAIEEFLSEPPGNGLGLSVASALQILRGITMTAAACATVAGILGVYILKRDRTARIALSVVAVPLFFTGATSGGFFASMVAAAALILWGRPARDWFDPDARAAQTLADRPVARPAGARTGEFPAAPPLPLPPQVAPPPPGLVIRGRRPDALVWACVLTWIGAALLTAFFGLLALMLAISGPELIAEVRKQQPDLQSAGLSDAALANSSLAFAMVVVVWSIVAIVLAILTFQGREWARVTLLVSAIVAAVFSVVMIPMTAFLSAPIAAACLVAVRCLTQSTTREWIRLGRSGRGW